MSRSFATQALSRTAKWRISYDFLDFGALAISISLFGKADRQVKETNDRGSDQLVEHVSVKQLP